jgi:hypothetical protein
MFEASVDGQPFDMERWGQYYRPAGMAAPSGATDADEDTPVSRGGGVQSKVASPAVTAAVTEEEDVPAATAPVVKPAAGGNKAEDILAMIRARQKSS